MAVGEMLKAQAELETAKAAQNRDTQSFVGRSSGIV
jgi:hypothetical protein